MMISLDFGQSDPNDFYNYFNGFYFLKEYFFFLLKDFLGFLMKPYNVIMY